MFFLKITLVCTFLGIFYQDSKDREVYWFLYPILGILFLLLQNTINDFRLTLSNALVNFVFVVFVMLCAYMYNYFKLKLVFLKEVFGLGDVLFFVFISFSFAPISFVILFVFSLCFSIGLHFVLKKEAEESVPLAGYMSLFFCLVIFFSFFSNVTFLYAY